MNLSKRNRNVLVMAAFIIAASAAISYAFSTLNNVNGQASVFQGQGQGGDLGQSIKDLTQGIIAGTNEQVQNTLQNAGNQALPQLPANASSYECIVVIMHFGKAQGAMTCSDSLSSSVTVNSQNAPGFSSQSSIQRQGGATSMQNQIQGSGSSANVIPGNVP